MEKYSVAVHITGKVAVTVKANSFEEALKIANNEVEGIDFGRLYDIEWDSVYAVRDDGKMAWKGDLSCELIL